MPEIIAKIIDNIIAKIIFFLIIIYLFLYHHPILAVIGLFTIIKLIHNSSLITGIDALYSYLPTEKKKNSQMTAFNQFPYTLEQEIVQKMAPAIYSGLSLTKATYRPLLEELHNAQSLSK